MDLVQKLEKCKSGDIVFIETISKSDERFSNYSLFEIPDIEEFGVIYEFRESIGHTGIRGVIGGKLNLCEEVIQSGLDFDPDLFYDDCEEEKKPYSSLTSTVFETTKFYVGDEIPNKLPSIMLEVINNPGNLIGGPNFSFVQRLLQ